MSYMTCLECGGDTHTESLPEHRLNNVTNTQPVEVRKVVCNHCENEGQLIQFAGRNPRTEIRDGSFAELTAEGLKTIRENLDFTPVYER